MPLECGNCLTIIPPKSGHYAGTTLRMKGGQEAIGICPTCADKIPKWSRVPLEKIDAYGITFCVAMASRNQQDGSFHRSGFQIGPPEFGIGWSALEDFLPDYAKHFLPSYREE